MRYRLTTSSVARITVYNNNVDVCDSKVVYFFTLGLSG